MHSRPREVATVRKVQATLTDRYQTTVPEPVRRALELRKRDRLRYAVRPNGEVVLTRVAPAGEDDPALEPFLEFLARDVAMHPEHLQGLDAGLVVRLRRLVGDVEIDLDAPLPDDEV